MSSLSIIERDALEDLFEMSSGYVMHPHLTNASLNSLVGERSGKDLYSQKYNKYGDSKAKRLRAFWDVEDDDLVSSVLAGLVEYWEHKNPDASQAKMATADRCRTIVHRLRGERPRDSREHTEAEFLKCDFGNIRLADVPIEAGLVSILEKRIDEASRSLEAGCPLSTVFLTGSVLEGLLLGLALAHPKEFNQSKSSPRDPNGKVRQFHDWNLAELINVATELGYLKLDVKKFSHVLRDFRNYIHPYQQYASRFAPDMHTAKICLQVLKAAIANSSRQES